MMIIVARGLSCRKQSGSSLMPALSPNPVDVNHAIAPYNSPVAYGDQIQSSAKKSSQDLNFARYSTMTKSVVNLGDDLQAFDLCKLIKPRLLTDWSLEQRHNTIGTINPQA
jgi:hypothetical protein